MVFNSYIFIFLFLPLTLGIYYLLHSLKKYEYAKVWLIGMSLWFYGYFNPSYLVIILTSIIGNYIIYKKLYRTNKKSLLILGIILNLAALFYFKYYDFFIENMNQAFGQSFTLKHILLPLGISFFTFQQISFLADTYRRETEEYGIIDYALFVTFFPQLVAGPIVTHSEMLPQFKDTTKRPFQPELFMRGIVLFTLGLFKKVILADTFGGAVNWGYANISRLDSTNALLVMLFYSIQLYFDFSGYCDMARGLGNLFGIQLPVNFDSPYKSATIIEFWKRWHITLNRFLTKYVYIPLGGNRKGNVRTYRNLLIVFFVSGVWHGAGWTFLIWGLLHGIFYILTKMCSSFMEKIPKWMGRIITFISVNIAWIFFRAESLSQANELLQKIAGLQFGPVLREIGNFFNLDEFWYIIKVLRLESKPYSMFYAMIGFLIISLGIIFFGKNADEIAQKIRPKVWNAIALAGMFVWCVLSFAGVSTFLYFNF